MTVGLLTHDVVPPPGLVPKAGKTLEIEAQRPAERPAHLRYKKLVYEAIWLVLIGSLQMVRLRLMNP